jgi:hypothetical protein
MPHADSTTSDTDGFERWTRDSESYRQFTDAARTLLASDPEMAQAHAEWEAFFVESHGDVFEQVDVPNPSEQVETGDPSEQVFVDALYYDFVVDRILAFAETTFGFEVTNPEPHHDTDALSVDFGGLHERVTDAASVAPNVADCLSREALLDADVGVLRELYESIVSREVRLALGEYYTPRGVAELAVESLETEDFASESFLDPGCGSGAFLAVCIDRKRAALPDDHAPSDTVGAVTDGVMGIDLNPVAVKSAKLAYVLSLLPELDAPGVDELEVPVYLADALGLTRDEGVPVGGATVGDSNGDPADERGDFAVDNLVGNPPWITWGNLTEAVKDAWRDTYVESLDLFPHGGTTSRLGHGNDDVSVQFVWVCIHRYLRAGGDASFVLKRAIAKGPAGKLLRTQRVDERPVAVRSVHDFGDCQPFGEQVGAGTAVYALATDEEPAFPISATAWTRASESAGGDEDESPDFSSAAAIRETLAPEETGFVPVETDDPTSAWVRQDAERRALGECDHEIRHGLKDDAKAVFGVDHETLDEIESDLVYPYLKSKHVVKYGLFGHDRHLVPMEKANEGNEAELRAQYPHTYDYLQSHRERLEDRASSWLEQGPFYNLFGLGEYTWADYKVVWCRLGFKPHFAVVSTVEDPELGEKQVVPGDHCMFVATDSEREAHFLTALLNSAPYQRCLRGMASEGKASLSKSVVSKLELPEYQGSEEEQRLAELSMEAHGIVPEHTDVSKREYNRTTIEELEVVQSEIDDIVEEMLAETPASPGSPGR